MQRGKIKMTDYIFGLVSAPEADDDSLDPPQWSPQGIENLKRNKMMMMEQLHWRRKPKLHL